MQPLIEKYNTILVVIGIGVVCMVVFFVNTTSNDPVEEKNLELPFREKMEETTAKRDETKINEKNNVFVDVKGEVAFPGLYEVEQGERLKFVIDQAGGFTEEADKKLINLAVKVTDEMLIYVPKIGEMEADAQLITQKGTSSSIQRVDLNTASKEDFETLPGIGPSKATAFVKYREENGPYQKIEDIKEISGVGEKTFEKLKEYIFVQ
ncbi:helix-hairpin-helix domain-containing protein [Rossellomorea aquimaris]|uniref:helix-hairpin-helix domain-containing protein n=1 Tax=Rossellomorea aquimaris TaxID=189382 RepID=UPI0007D07B73|nr:helix-hairpin-helix domain-containing protein [Rossellomorea aquimaris]